MPNTKITREIQRPYAENQKYSFYFRRDRSDDVKFDFRSPRLLSTLAVRNEKLGKLT